MWKLCLEPLCPYVEPVDLHLKLLCGTFEFLCEPFLVFGTYVWTLSLIYVEASSAEQLSVTECAAFRGNLFLEPLSQTFMWSWPVETLSESFAWNLYLATWGTKMWNLVNLEPRSVESL